MSKITAEDVCGLIAIAESVGQPVTDKAVALVRALEKVRVAAKDHFCGRKGATPANLPHIYCSICYALADVDRIKKGETP